MKRAFLVILLVLLCFLAYTPVMAKGVVGEEPFNKHCVKCHGKKGVGTVLGYGPPLVHKIYEPSHHGDASFYMAVTRGVRSHHWGFGNMPPIQGVTRAQVGDIIRYIRALQREAGIN